ncbi:hypothetical protein SCUCBS95973_005559 [Sporothrix curviconia]|uniref:MFS transporter n=1 Tax=Sporothrix curviconia TaxID=1260050 RepID=A0ABP0BZR7_9PEZI
MQEIEAPVEHFDAAAGIEKSGIEKSGIDTTAHHGGSNVDPSLDRRVRLKLDLYILPVLSCVLFFASMGRSDLANAKVADMQV